MTSGEKSSGKSNASVRLVGREVAMLSDVKVEGNCGYPLCTQDKYIEREADHSRERQHPAKLKTCFVSICKQAAVRLYVSRSSDVFSYAELYVAAYAFARCIARFHCCDYIIRSSPRISFLIGQPYFTSPHW